MEKSLLDLSLRLYCQYMNKSHSSIRSQKHIPIIILWNSIFSWRMWKWVIEVAVGRGIIIGYKKIIKLRWENTPQLSHRVQMRCRYISWNWFYLFFYCKCIIRNYFLIILKNIFLLVKNEWLLNECILTSYEFDQYFSFSPFTPL